MVATYTTGTYTWCFNPTLNKIQGGNNVYNQVQSGSTIVIDDTNSGYVMFYDVDNNVIKYTADKGASYETGYTLPFCITSLTNGTGITTIDQLFNGFGYIGSTCYILPGITGYIPQGLNSDGTLINEITTQTKISIKTVTSSWGTGSELFFFNGIDSDIHRASKNCLYQATQPIVYDVENYWFNTETGKFYETKNSGASWSEFRAIPAFTITFDKGKITSLKSCGVHELVNSNATNLSNYGKQVISGLGKPSNKYIDFTLGASGVAYIAPANGWFFMDVGLTDEKGSAKLSCGVIGASAIPQTGVSVSYALLPVYSGNVVKLTYNLSAKVNALRFIYANGDQ